ncbi:eukaryotic membrane protein family-domain-containing protein [Parachaetomium inaequale]|uniref:Eukaryotic membrane protein family-domain-containing protein n=1 Tax=Parachaetomium inaequale TaxID=2588326 RepID=A0AAN6PCT2_9PEZI|nr:eukaryotic membrane protein family-domain-containing protein [Parachaetomium inaequale]
MESTERRNEPAPSSAIAVEVSDTSKAALGRATDRPSGRRRSWKGSQNATTQLPSPTLTPSHPSPRQAPAANISRERALSSPTAGVPTPDPSGDSQSDGEPSRAPPSTGHTVPGPAPAAKDPANVTKTRSRSNTKTSNPEGIRRLSASKMQELTAAPGSLPVAAIRQRAIGDPPLTAGIVEASRRLSRATEEHSAQPGQADFMRSGPREDVANSTTTQGRPAMSGRTLSTPPMGRRKTTSQPATQQSSRRNSFQPAQRPAALELDGRSNHAPATNKTTTQPRSDKAEPTPPSPIPPAIPLPPMSIPTLLQLELAGQRPSPLYIHHSYASDIPYESSAIKFERLKNFLLLPWFLERAMTFGAAACFDAWLWTFTVLPMRFCIAASVLVRWWAYVVGKEMRWMVGFVWSGLGRMWQRGRRGRRASRAGGRETRAEESRSRSRVRDERVRDAVPDGAAHASGVTGAGAESTSRRPSGLGTGAPLKKPSTRPPGMFRHRRTKSSPSNLTSFHKADLLQGAILICSSIALMNLDASRMYHFIRAQSAIKLYAIYNLLEVGDRLLSALGQDIFECLFSTETLSRNSSGRSKVMLPLGMFLLALMYNILHSVILFYQVIALNVAVNSYSNALLTLLLSNQFVEIKSAVFKRFEKENTFQLACADIVERFQLWIMLIIIGMRNVVEVGGLSVPGAGSEDSGPSSIPLHTSSILPASFTILPSWLWSGEVLSPFIVVIGSEMIVDWIKHAYINKFNNIKPTFYARILDILCKDYYTNAFVTPSLTRRLGLPLLPLSCLFIRASVQIYNMFLATHLPTPLPPTSQTSLSVDNATPSPAMLAALDRIDHLIRSALGRSVFGYPYAVDNATGGGDGALPVAAGFASRLARFLLPSSWFRLSSDDAIAALTMVVVFLLLFLVLLVVKLLLGMVLLRYARDRYARMKVKEQAVAAGLGEKESFDARGKRTGGYGQVEVGDERRRWIFGEDGEGLRKARERERKVEGNVERDREKDFGRVMRYEMVARRIW